MHTMKQAKLFIYSQRIVGAVAVGIAVASIVQKTAG